MTLHVDMLSAAGVVAAVILLYVALASWWEGRAHVLSRLFAALALVGAWWAMGMAVAHVGLLDRWPHLIQTSQLLSGLAGPLSFLFTLAYVGRLARWSWRWALVLLPGLCGTASFLMACTVPAERIGPLVAASLSGSADPRDVMARVGPWMAPLQLAHAAQLVVFFLAGAAVYLWEGQRARARRDRFELRLIGALYFNLTAAVTGCNLLPLAGADLYWTRLPPLLNLPFALALFGFMRRRVVSAARLLREREALLTYLPTRSVDHLLAAPGASGGTRIEAAVLFCDLRGFSALCERLPAADVVRFVDRYFRQMSTVILAEGGMVKELVGDGIVAVFGVPVPMEGPCAAAVRAARRMHAALAELNRSHPPADGEPVRMGVGVHYGPLIAGTLGGAARRVYSVFGDTVNTASRIEPLSKETGHDILVSREVLERLDAAARDSAVPLGRFALRGKTRLVELFGIRTGA